MFLKKTFLIACPNEKSLILCFAKSEDNLSGSIPQSFSVNDLKKISYNFFPNRFIIQLQNISSFFKGKNLYLK